MQQKFSFKETNIYVTVGEVVKVFSNFSNLKSKITIKLESNNKKLNGFYTIQPNGLILEFIFEKTITLNATRIWGAVWDFNGSLDITITESRPSIKIVEQNILKLPHVVNKKSMKNIGFTREQYFFNKSVDNTYKIFLNSNIKKSSLSVSDNAILEIVQQNIPNKRVEISFEELFALNVVLQLTYNTKTFNLPGKELDNLENLAEIVDQIKWIAEKEKLSIFSYLDNNKIIITRTDTSVKNIRLHGPLNNIEKVFEKDTPYYEYNIIHLNKELKEDIIELTINDPLVKKNKSIINILNKSNITHNNFNISIDKDICKISALVNGSKEYILVSTELGYSNLQTVNDNTELQWRIKTNNFSGIANFTLKSDTSSITKSVLIQKNKREAKLYYKLKNFKKFSYLYLYSNQEVNYTHKIEFKILDNKNTKLNRDFSIQQKNFVIEKGEKKKKIKIKWLNKKAFNQFKIQIGSITIPIKYVDTEYYPSHIKIENNTHILNKGISTHLKLKYFDLYTTGEITLAPMQTVFEYFPNSSSVEWELYDDTNMIWRKEFHYTIYQPEIEIQYPKNTKFGIPFDIKFKLNTSYTKPIKLKIQAESNLNANLNQTHQIKINEKEKVFTITPTKTKAIGWIVFRVKSLTDDILIDESKKVIMID